VGKIVRYNVVSFRQSDTENARLMEIVKKKRSSVSDVIREALALWEARQKLLT
jgi:Arc/MetJ-type ribon-helix-helix transcriptional regulator